MENALQIVLENIKDFDYFDIKNIQLSKKSFYDIGKEKAYINTSYENKVYILLYTFFTNIIPHKYKTIDEHMGFKIIFKGRKKYLYTRNNDFGTGVLTGYNILNNEIQIVTLDYELENMRLFATDIDILFTIGITCKQLSSKSKHTNNILKVESLYFGNTTHYECCDIEDVIQYRDDIKTYIADSINDIKEVDIYYYNVDTDVAMKFVSEFTRLIRKCSNINIHNENVVENILLCHKI